jgi:hypothetical protein
LLARKKSAFGCSFFLPKWSAAFMIEWLQDLPLTPNV